MTEKSGHMRLRAMILGISFIVGMAVVGFSVAEGAKQAIPAGSGGAGELIGVRILDAEAGQLIEWGIEPLKAGDGGGILAHVTEEQLERLRAEGMAFAELGRVAVITSENAAALGFCSGSNNTDVPLDSGWSPSYVDLSGCSVWGGARVTLVSYYVQYETLFLTTGFCPDCYAQLNTILGNSTDLNSTTLHSYQSACCAPKLQSESEEALATYGCILSGTTHAFDGDTVNQEWWLSTQDNCSDGIHYTLDYWEIYVY